MYYVIQTVKCHTSQFCTALLLFCYSLVVVMLQPVEYSSRPGGYPPGSSIPHPEYVRQMSTPNTPTAAAAPVGNYLPCPLLKN